MIFMGRVPRWGMTVRSRDFTLETSRIDCHFGRGWVRFAIFLFAHPPNPLWRSARDSTMINGWLDGLVQGESRGRPPDHTTKL